MPYLVTYQRTFNVGGGGDQQDNDSDTLESLAGAKAWVVTKTNDGWLSDGTLSVQTEITLTSD